MITSHFLTTETPQGFMDIYIARPESDKKLPVIIVLMEAFGVNSHIKSICERFATEGFVAMAPDLFHREARRIVVPYDDRMAIMPLLSKMTNDEIIDDVAATIDFSKTLATADSNHISTVGFCVGGFASALSATRLPLKKMVSFYGGGMVASRPGIGLTPIVGQFNKIKCPSLFFFGGKDASIPPSDVKAIEASLREGHISHQINIYPDSDHGFFCDERKTYNQSDANIAWSETIQFLKS